MRATRLNIKNIGIIEDVDIQLDKPLTVFFGQIQQGKSTILRGISILAGGSFPDDLLRHGATQGKIFLGLDCGSICRTFYRQKTGGKTMARPIEYVRDGEVQRGNVVKQLSELFNPFLLDNDYFRRMNERQRRAYLLDVLDVDTSEQDGAIETLTRANTDLRAQLKGMGDIEKPEPVEVPDEIGRAHV